MTALSTTTPVLVVLVAPPGAGKSTWAACNFRPTRVVNLDTYRAWLADDEGDQTVTREAVDIMHTVVRTRMSHAKPTVVDATNVKPEDRQALIRHARNWGHPGVLVVLHTPLERCLSWNAARPRRVADDVIAAMHAAVQARAAAIHEEASTALHIGPDGTKVHRGYAPRSIRELPWFAGSRESYGPLPWLDAYHWNHGDETTDPACPGCRAGVRIAGGVPS